MLLVTRYSILFSSYSVRSIDSVVGMSVYVGDKQEWVGQAIESVLDQSYRDFLFVIVIDGPIGKGLKSLILKFAEQDNRIVVLENSVNQGLASSMNTIINWSLSLQPKYFFRMDSDDISDPTRLAKQVQYFVHNETVSIVGSALVEIDESGDRVGVRLMPTSHQKIVNGLARRCTLNHPTVAIKYDVFRDGYRYEESMRNTQDYFFWIELASNGYIFRNLKDTLIQFRRVNNFYKRRGVRKSLNEFKARWLAMYTLNSLSLLNVFYACSVLFLRLMPRQVLKLAYRVDRYMLQRNFKS